MLEFSANRLALEDSVLLSFSLRERRKPMREHGVRKPPLCPADLPSENPVQPWMLFFGKGEGAGGGGGCEGKCADISPDFF